MSRHVALIYCFNTITSSVHELIYIMKRLVNFQE